MTDVQKKLFELLTDLDDICKRRHIDYYLCAETAHGAFVKKAFHEDCCEASVAMTPENARKFIAAVKAEKRADRIVDSMYSNKNYPDFTLRFGDPNTLMMRLPYKAVGPIPCIGVTVHMIRCKPRRLGKLYTLTKYFWKACLTPVSVHSRAIVRVAAAVCHGIKTVLGGTNVSRLLFKLWCSLFSANRKAKKISVGDGKFSFSADLLAEKEDLELEGGTFTTFGYIDEYFKAAYGSSFKDKTPKYTKASSSLLASVCVPYGKYLAYAQAQGLDFEKIARNKRKFDAQQKKVSAYNKVIDKYYAIVDRTDKRFAMYEMYMPIKDQLLQLYREERFEELNELLHPYRSALWSCYKKGLGLCFDKEIFELTMDLLRREGSYTYARKLRAKVPEQHWAPMVITDYKGEPV